MDSLELKMNGTIDGITSVIPVEVDVAGVSAIAVFYVLMILVGGWATWNHQRHKYPQTTSKSEELLLAGRQLGLFTAAASLSATQVGGAFLSGTAEEVYKNGILWCCVPFAYISGMILNGATFAKTMRRRGYVTVFDPIQENFGRAMGGLCLVPHIIGDLFWIGAVLSVLGSTLTVSMGLRKEISILISSAVGLVYTLMGGMWSVAYTDVLQLIVVAFGLFLALPFILTNEAVVRGGYGEAKDWFGSISSNQAGTYVDAILVPLLGGIPWQGYYQRVLSLKKAEQTLQMSILASLPSIVLLVPPILIGGVAKTVAWNETDFGSGVEDASLILPLALRYLLPSAVTFVGVGAVTAAVISTIDSTVLGAGSAIANNIYKGLLRKKASDIEIVWCTRTCVLIVGVAASAVAFGAESIYGLCGVPAARHMSGQSQYRWTVGIIDVGSGVCIISVCNSRDRLHPTPTRQGRCYRSIRSTAVPLHLRCQGPPLRGLQEPMGDEGWRRRQRLLQPRGTGRQCPHRRVHCRRTQRLQRSGPQVGVFGAPFLGSFGAALRTSQAAHVRFPLRPPAAGGSAPPAALLTRPSTAVPHKPSPESPSAVCLPQDHFLRPSTVPSDSG